MNINGYPSVSQQALAQPISTRQQDQQSIPQTQLRQAPKDLEKQLEGNTSKSLLVNSREYLATLGVATGAIAGAEVGSVVPVVGTLIGAALGAVTGYALGRFGSGKGAAQMMRDSWRDSMEESGFAQKKDGSHHVTLADASVYNIGVDGSNKLTNLDGSKRHTFEIDWGNSLAVEAIPEAHIFVLATGLDPSMSDENLWNTATSQALNAATSNTSTAIEVSENFRAMLSQGAIDPRQLALRVEMLRVSNKISDQEYTVYLDKTNKLFDTKLLPTNRDKAHFSLISNLQTLSNPTESDRLLLENLIEPLKQEQAREALLDRLSGREDI